MNSRLIEAMPRQQQARRGQDQPQEPVDPQQPGNPYWPFDPHQKREAMAPQGQQRIAADAPSISDPNFENWYNSLPPDQKLKYRPIYLQWLQSQNP